jgi:hypothetical protein
MRRSRLLCGGTEAERSSDATEVETSTSAELPPRIQILLGVQTPENTFVEVPNTIVSEAPSSNIQSLWASTQYHRKKISSIFKFRAKRKELVDDQSAFRDQASTAPPTKNDNGVVRHQPSAEQVITLETNLATASTNMIHSSHILASDSSVTYSTSEENIPTVLLAEENMKNKERTRNDDTRLGNIVAGATQGSETALQTSVASKPTKHPSILGSVSETSSALDGTQNFIPSPLQDPSEVSWIGAAQVRAPKGETKVLKIFYDSGSTDSMVTEDLVREGGFEPRPILPEDLKIYAGANSNFIPRYYIELELKDEEHGIEEYTKASFNIAQTLGGRPLLVGRTFMHKHRLGLSRVGGAESLVLTARSASKSMCLFTISKTEDGQLTKFNRGKAGAGRID